jgi:hypothetical protein
MSTCLSAASEGCRNMDIFNKECILLAYIS